MELIFVLNFWNLSLSANANCIPRINRKMTRDNERNANITYDEWTYADDAFPFVIHHDPTCTMVSHA